MLRAILLSLFAFLPWLLFSQSNLGTAQQRINDSGEMTWEQATRKVQEFMDAESLMNCMALDNTTKAFQILDFLEGFHERNDFQVLFHAYINGTTFWEHSFSHRKIAQWNSADVETLKIRIIFDRISENTEGGYTVSTEITSSPSILKSLNLTQTDLDAFLNENRLLYALLETYQKPIDAHEAILQAVIATLAQVEGKIMPELDLSIEGGLVYDHFIIHDDAWLRKPESPGEFIKPTQRVDLGLRVAFLQEMNVDGKSVAKLRDMSSGDTIYITNRSDYISKIKPVKKEIAYKLTNDYDAVSLPYGIVASGSSYEKNEEFIVSHKCGNYLKVKDDDEEIEGHWISGNMAVAVEPEVILSTSDLENVFKSTDKETIEEVVEVLNTYSNSFGLTTVDRMANFLAQIGYESNGFKGKSGESGCYTESNVNGWHIWFNLTWKERPYGTEYDNSLFEPSHRSKKLKWTSLKCDSLKSDCIVVPEEYVCSQSSEEHNKHFFSYVYQAEGGNGDSKSSDGYKFRGHGAIQLTWKKNYIAFQNWLQHNFQNAGSEPIPDVLNSPDLLDKNKELFILSALWFWEENKLNQLVDEQNFVKLTMKINSGQHGKDKRRSLTNKIQSIL